jgi:RecB family exonuclease
MKGGAAINTAVLLARVREILRAQTGEVLLIAPSADAADECVRTACGRALVGVHRYSLDRLAWAMAGPRLAGEGLAPIGPLAAEAVASAVIHRTTRAGRLTYFAPISGSPGFPRALVRTLRELRLEQVSPAMLSQTGAGGSDLAVLLDAWAAELEERRLADFADVYAAATAEVESHRLAGLPLILLEVRAAARREQEFLDRLIELACEVVRLDLAAVEAGPAGTELESCQRWLFSPESPPGPPRDGSFEFFSASSAALECVEIARRIQHSGVPFDETAILLRNVSEYQGLVAEALRRAGIPAYFARDASRPDAGGRALLLLLECASQDLSAARFTEYLSLGQVPSEEGSTAPVSRWERIIDDAAVIGGRERWRRRLLAQVDKYEGDDRREIGQDLLEFAPPLIDKLSALPSSALWGEWLDALHELARTALRRPEAVEELLEELAPMADAGPVGIADVLFLLRDRLRSMPAHSTDHRYGRVFVAPIEHAAGFAFRQVFVPGLCEGRFPKPVVEDPLLLDRAKAAIPAALSRSSDEDERQLLRTGVASATERLTISWPRIDVLAGRERVPSLYVFELVKAARGDAATPREIDAEARAGAETQLGWPAPADEGAAIDELEYDLAVLDRAFRNREEGGGAYLKEASPILLDCLRARGRRWRPKWHEEDGLITSNAHDLIALESYRPTRRAHSPTSLQRWAACPYQFALHAVVRLRPFERASAPERMDAATRGEVFHLILARLFARLEATGLLPLRLETLERTYDELDAVLEEAAEATADETSPAIPQLWAGAFREIRADARGWLAARLQDGFEWTPLAWEREFEDCEVLDGMHVRGRIDLVEQRGAGSLRVVDFKTGRPPQDRPMTIGGGEVLQPALYALAAKRLFESDVSAGRLEYATLRANFEVTNIPVSPLLKAQAGRLLRAVDESLREGDLRAAPRAEACINCDYLPICGPYEEERFAAKKPEGLKELLDLRRLK